MGTTSSIHFSETYKDNDNKLRVMKYCAIFQPYNGYPSEVGKFLAEFLQNTNFNEMGKLAARFITRTFADFDDIEITTEKAKEDYNYYINYNINKREFQIKVLRISGTEIFKGNKAEFLKFCGV